MEWVVIDLDGTLTKLRLPWWMEWVIYWAFKYVPGFTPAFGYLSLHFPPNLRMVERARKAKREGRKIRIKTVRPVAIHHRTVQWLNRWGIPHDDVRQPDRHYQDPVECTLALIGTEPVEIIYDNLYNRLGLPNAFPPA